MQRLIGRAHVARLKQRLRVEAQGFGAAAGGVRSRESRRGIGVTARPAVQVAGGERRVGTLLEREDLLERDQRVVLSKHHLERFTQQHPGVGVLGEAARGFLRRRERSPSVFDGATQAHERRVRLRERRRQGTTELQPQGRALGRIALTGRGAPHGKAGERGAQRTEHDRLHQSMSHASRPPGSARPLAGRRIVVTRAREQAGDLARELETLGATVVRAPAIRIEVLADLEPLRRALSHLADYRWVVFTSQNTVHVVLDRLAAWGHAAGDLARTRVAAIGPATAKALAGYGITA